MIESAAPNIGKDQDLLTFVYDAFNRRDIEPILAVMHSNVEWPNGMEGGWVHGHEEVRAYWLRQWKVLDPHVAPIRFESDEEERVVVYVKQLVRDLKGTIILDRMVRHIYTIEDGLISRMDIQE
ncbi:MAG TPA: nuclear transport factor 2 family protein [Terriglobales bacterium]|jgi:ketosteroid isomerase-like protein